MTIRYILTNIALIAGFLLVVVAVAHMLRQHRSPAGTAAWLLIIILLPYVGVPLYFLFGGRKSRRIARSKADIQLPDSTIIPLSEANLIDRLLRTYNIPGATTGNRVSLCDTGEEAYDRLVQLIEQAHSSIHLLMFILAEDKVGEDIVNRLARRAADGLCVRVLLDGLGSMHTKQRFLKPIVEAGGKTDFFIPVIIHRPLHGRANLRNHRKMLITDEQYVMAGGTNIAEEYIGPTPRPGRWHDLSFVLEGPAVKHYASIFASDWEFATGESFSLPSDGAASPPGSNGSSVVQVVPSGPDVPGDPMYDAILTAAFSARERLWIITPYFIPDESLLQALILAAHRGIDLRILVPEKSNHRMADVVRGTYLRDVQKAGGTIFLYTGSMVHAKSMLMDDKLAMIGSANMDMRSLFLNYEVAMFAYSAKDIATTERWIEKLLAGSQTGVAGVSGVRDVCEGVVRMMAPLL